MSLQTLPPGPPYDPIDWDFLRSFGAQVVDGILDSYFRARIVGAEKLPVSGPVVLAPNHSGNALPHDAMILDYGLWRRRGFAREAKLRTVFAPELTAVNWLRLFGIDDWYRRCGGVDMTFRNFEQLLATGKQVIYYPEGIPGIGKGFNRRYQLQDFHTSFVILAARYDVPVHIVSVVNAEYVNPISLTYRWLDRLAWKALHLPFFPVPIVFLALIFPFIFYLAFPARMVFVIQDAIDVRALLREAGISDCGKLHKEECRAIARRIQAQAQRQLDEAVRQYGRPPYDLKGLTRSLRAARGRALRATPLGWPFAFLQTFRDRYRPPARNRIVAWLRDLDILSYYLPGGWALIALFRLIRKPPYGYRGLTREQRKWREGRYLWSLNRRPLPVSDAEQAAVGREVS